MLYNIIIFLNELKLYKGFYLYSDKLKMFRFESIKSVVIDWLYKLYGYI